MTNVGIISDTHNLLRPAALALLKASDLILHAGDIGDASILSRLRDIAPVHAVRGNTDTESWATAVPISAVVEVEGRTLYLLHDIGALDLDPSAAGFDAVIYGHTHKAQSEKRRGVWFINPGSAGPKRFSLPITVATLAIDGPAELTVKVHSV